MSTAPPLENAVINLAALREHARNELIRVLDSVKGKKGLVLDPKLSGPLGLIAEGSLLKEHGVEKFYHLTERLETECKTLIYLIRPKLSFMKCVADHIHEHQREEQKKQYNVFFVPRRTMIAERHLEEEGVYDDVVIGEYHLDLIPFEQDVLSLELEDSYRECFLDGDRTSLFYMARSLMKIQSMFGIIPHIKGKGACAKSVMDMLVRMRREMGRDEPTMITPEIDTLILLDRQTDMVTPMCTQLTYEGMIDETFGIKNTYVELAEEMVSPPDEKKKDTAPRKPPGSKVPVPLNSNDRLYSEVRDLNFSVLGPFLNKRAKEVDDYYKKRYEFKTVTQIRDFMKGLPGYQQEHQSLRLHTNICETIIGFTKGPEFRRRLEAEQSLLAGLDDSLDYIEECIDKKEPFLKVLRLLVLQCLTNGIKAKQFEYIKNEVLQTYGYEYLFTLNNLEKLGLLKGLEGKSTFGIVRKVFNLIVEDIDEKQPTDIAYVYSGYAPLSVRLVQHAMQPGGWRSIEEVLRALPGPTFEKEQQLPAGVIDDGASSHFHFFPLLVLMV
ncbi:Vacuolar protein-sorting-associated protein 33, variant 2 [Balamuthia mandrillaris]